MQAKLTFSPIHCSTPSDSLSNLYRESASNNRCLRSFASSSNSL